MAWTWQLTRAEATKAEPATGETTTVEQATGEATTGAPAPSEDLFGAPARGFASQADAETWLGSVWRELAAGGVSAASLFEDDRLVYGPMSLEPS